MAFDQVHVLRPPLRLAVRVAHRPHLSLAIRREQAARHVVRQTDPLNHAVDVIAVAHGVVESLEHDDTGAFADDEPVGIRIEGSADPRSGQRPQLTETHLRVEAFGPGDPARQHRIGPAGVQFVTRQLDRVKARRAGRIECACAAPQSERYAKQARGQCRNARVQRRRHWHGIRTAITQK